jgi:hypothetical protein
MRLKALLSSPLYLFFALLSPFFLRAQQNKLTSELLTATQVSAIINDSVKRAFKINFPIIRVYKYTDRSGQYYCVLTETMDSIGNSENGGYDTIHHSIRAINLKADGNGWTKAWELNDFVLKPKEQKPELSIWFWTRFFGFQDLDNDGLIEPILVYGTRTDDIIDGPRIKIIIYYKGQKIAMRHKECDLDGGRSTEFDKAYENLPQKIRDNINAKMKFMEKEQLAAF